MINLIDKSPKLLVIGDLIIDYYLWGSCARISPEAPVQLVNVDKENIKLGGAGNVLSNLKALGAKADVISVIGDCKASDELHNLLNSIDIDMQYLVVQSNRTASKKTRVIASQQQMLRFDCENVEDISIESERSILNIFKKIVVNYDIILLSDYGKGVLTNELTQSLITIANQHNKKVLVDPKGLDYSKYKGAYLLTPNKKEASEATKINIKDDESLNRAIIQLKTDCELEVSLITLSEQGLAIYDDKFRIHATTARKVFDVTGAGDTVLASLGFALACQYEIDAAATFANFAAGVVVEKVGSATVTLSEIIEHKARLTNDSSVKTLVEITQLSKALKARGKKIVFTNGCFDIIHIGHIKYLETAKSFGDVLILGLNSDQSVKTLKGEGRPINVASDRAYILSALEVVDYVVIFAEDSPYRLIQAIKPHTLVKGGDYKNCDVVGQDIADELKIVQFIADKSTTQTIEKIRQIP